MKYNNKIQELRDVLFEEKGVRVLMKRDDLYYLPVEPGDHAFCGNKWRKLKYNLLEAQAGNYTTLCTFGGAFSNHIAASAAAGVLFGFKTIGIIRGEASETLNPTLAFARRCGMELHYVDRERYRDKGALNIAEITGIRSDSLYILPEGGTNALALQGCRELAQEILAEERPDICCVSCGTGGTFVGLLQGFEGKVEMMGFSALKGSFMHEHIKGLLRTYDTPDLDAWSLNTAYHFGGYARCNTVLVDFIHAFKARHGILLDPVYTGKLCYGVVDLIREGAFPRGTTICLVHTGGLQGNRGFVAQGVPIE